MTLKRTRHLNIYIAIKELREEHPEYPVSGLCELGNITRAAYYKWLNHTDNIEWIRSGGQTRAVYFCDTINAGQHISYCLHYYYQENRWEVET